MTAPASPAPAAPATAPRDFAVTLTLEGGSRFAVDARLPGAEGFAIDEPPPVGDGSAANPTRVLAAALASCLGSSLLFCLAKSRIPVRGLRIEAGGALERNERGRLRVAGFDIRLFPDVDPADVPRMQRCLEVFEDYCTVTGSVRRGVPVEVGVISPAAGDGA